MGVYYYSIYFLIDNTPTQQQLLEREPQDKRLLAASFTRRPVMMVV